MNAASLIANRSTRSSETTQWFQHFQQTQDLLLSIAAQLKK